MEYLQVLFIDIDIYRVSYIAPSLTAKEKT